MTSKAVKDGDLVALLAQAIKNFDLAPHLPVEGGAEKALAELAVGLLRPIIAKEEQVNEIG